MARRSWLRRNYWWMLLVSALVLSFLLPKEWTEWGPECCPCEQETP